MIRFRRTVVGLVGACMVFATFAQAAYAGDAKPQKPASVTSKTQQSAPRAGGDELYRMQQIETRWVSFENPTGGKGMGGKRNKGAKGYAFDAIHPGEQKVLMDVKGCGIIRRIWMTLSDRDPEMMRGMRIDIYWDNAKKPAVSAPLSDFFCVGHGRILVFENEFFSSPSATSFNCTIPMPFRTRARVTLTNETERIQHFLFYDIEYTLGKAHDKDVLYFHTHWRRENPTKLGKDFEIMPLVKGKGRYLGANVGVIDDPRYESTWWGEGEVKIYLDGDKDLATLVGTGTEDYPGAGWGLPNFSHRYGGSRVEDKYISFYRLHVPDPIYFQKDCRVTLQQLGATGKASILSIAGKGVPLKVTAADRYHVTGEVGQFERYLESNPNIKLEDIPDEGIYFYREDDVSATAYFYLNSPENNLPLLAPYKERVAGL